MRKAGWAGGRRRSRATPAARPGSPACGCRPAHHPQRHPTCFMAIWIRHFLKLRISVHTWRLGGGAGGGGRARCWWSGGLRPCSRAGRLPFLLRARRLHLHPKPQHVPPSDPPRTCSSTWRVEATWSPGTMQQWPGTRRPRAGSAR